MKQCVVVFAAQETITTALNSYNVPLFLSKECPSIHFLLFSLK